MIPTLPRNLPETQNSTAYVQLHTFGSALMAGPASMVIKGHRGRSIANSWRNLIVHEASKTKLWFDLGISDDLSQYPPTIRINQHRLFNAEAAKNNILDDVHSRDIDPMDIQHIVVSHAHWDHVYPVGSYFPNATVICGPGTLDLTAESWPEYVDSPFDGRVWSKTNSELPLTELADPAVRPDMWQPIGTFQHGHDFFGDGSFWIIYAPGHYPGNLMALVRTRNKHGERRWVMLAGDSIHHSHLVHFPEAPFGDGLTITQSGTLHEDEAQARDVIRRLAALKDVYGSELFVWPAHGDVLEGIWEL